MADALPKRAMLVINAQSRRGEAAFEEARDKLAAAGIELLDAHAVKDPQVMEPIVKAAIAKAPMVIVGGGDGTRLRRGFKFSGPAQPGWRRFDRPRLQRTPRIGFAGREREETGRHPEKEHAPRLPGSEFQCHALRPDGSAASARTLYRRDTDRQSRRHDVTRG